MVIGDAGEPADEEEVESRLEVVLDRLAELCRRLDRCNEVLK